MRHMHEHGDDLHEQQQGREEGARVVPPVSLATEVAPEGGACEREEGAYC